MTLKEAKAYINYGIHQGVYDDEQFKGITDEELIVFAETESGRAENEYDRLKDEGLR